MNTETKEEIIHLTVGSSKEITLALPSAGILTVPCGWMVESLPSTLWLEDIEHIPGQARAPGMVGAGKDSVKFTILGVRPGAGHLRFVLARNRSPEKPVDHAVYNVHVDAK